MKEHVILDRTEYLDLIEKANLNQDKIDNKVNEQVKSYISNIIKTLDNAYITGFKKVLWGSDEVKDKIFRKYMRDAAGYNDINNFTNAINSVYHAIQDMVEETRLLVQEKDMVSNMRDTTYKQLIKLNKFNSLPWYKKMFFIIHDNIESYEK